MTDYLLTPAAKTDLRAILDYIRQDNPRAAQVVLRAFRQAMRKLAANPRLGHLREDLADEPLRFWNVYSFLLVYRETTPVQLIRVLRGSRDIRAILEGE